MIHHALADQLTTKINDIFTVFDGFSPTAWSTSRT
jgi:hypothetical protein